MGSTLQKAITGLGSLLPSVRTDRRVRRLRHELLARLDHVEHLAQRLDHLIVGSSATYVGNNRVLIRIIVGHHLFLLYVHADDKLISPSLIVNGRYEPELTEYFVKELRPDSHCIDVGANIGYFSCLMAKFCPRGRILGLEPNPPVHAIAIDNILLNALGDRATILNLAASDEAGDLTLYHRIGRSGNTSLAACGEDFTRAFQEPPEEAFTTPTVRIDDLRDQLSGRVDFLKIDVEGAEPLALAGARETIAANPQLQILMEWAPAQISHAGFDVPQFARDIAAFGLRPYVLTDHLPWPVSHAELADLPYQIGVLLTRDAA